MRTGDASGLAAVLLRQKQQIEAFEQRLAKLTARESQVLDMIVAGFANKQIGLHLKISERTVEVHRARIMRKMEVGSLPELVCLFRCTNCVFVAASNILTGGVSNAVDGQPLIKLGMNRPVDAPTAP